MTSTADHHQSNTGHGRGGSALDTTRIQDLLERAPGIERLRAALCDCDGSAEALTALLAQYVSFDSAFAPGVLHLAAQISLRSDLFRDPVDGLPSCGDRSTEVAGFFFQAVIDEYGEWKRARLPTHRRLAQLFLEGIVDFFGLDPMDAERAMAAEPETLQAMAAVLEGYASGGEIDDRRLFRGLGFHIASEVLAAHEFHLIDDLLSQRWPALASSLRETRVDVRGLSCAPILWLLVHRTVESEHADWGLQGASYALDHYHGDRHEALSWIYQGLSRFIAVHDRFMTSLLGAAG